MKSLDRVKAVENGLADKAILVDLESSLLTLEDGRSLYETYIQRPRVVGGAKPVSAKRYRAVFDKFETFARQEGFRTWNEVNHTVLEKYAAYLDDDGYAYATEYLELTTIKQVVKWLISEGKLPGSHAIRLPLRKPQGTTTYSWTPAEVHAMVSHCFANKELHYLGEIIVALACTGLRISELASLRWKDIDLQRKRISLTDESRHGRNLGTERRETKSGRSRSFPIHEDF